MSRRKIRRQHRRDRREARARAASTIVPPEGVPLQLPIAGIGVRLAAQITDIIITGAFAVALLVFLGTSGVAGANTIVAVFALVFFAIRVPYYALSELAWNGQTIGKKFLRIKVVAHDGGSLTTHALVLRNLMKEAEVFLPGTLLLTLDAGNPIASWLGLGWILMTLCIPLTNPYRMRLGDMMAGTHVVRLPVSVLLSDVTRAASPSVTTHDREFRFLPHQLDHYGNFELQTLESLLRAEGATDPAGYRQRQETLESIVDRIRKKIGYADVVDRADHERFLREFYKVQRAHLEQRQLFGDKRADKHHRDRQAG